MAKLLLIDDDPRMRRLVDEFMGMNGHEVLFAQDGALGVSLSSLERPDLIILDMMMPVMGGQEAMAILKAEPGLKGIPVVVVSANNDPDLRQQMLDAGAVAYITKPIDLQELLACIDGTLTFRPNPN